jgi:hypothetical protein
MKKDLLRLFRFFAYIAIFMLFVWVARHFVAFTESYGCRDAGGIVKAGICVGTQQGQWPLVSARPFSGWLVSLGLPAIVALFIWKLIESLSAAVRRLRKR